MANDSRLSGPTTRQARTAAQTAVPGWGLIFMGCIALAVAFFSSANAYSGEWLGWWLIGAIAASAIGIVTMTRKSLRLDGSVTAGPGRRFTLSLCPPLFAGAIFTALLYKSDMIGALPGVWLLLYGVAVLSAGAYSIALVPMMGLTFLVLGVIALFTPAALGTLWLAIGFGAVHILVGAVIVRKYGG